MASAFSGNEMSQRARVLFVAIILGLPGATARTAAADEASWNVLDDLARAVEPRVIEWRRDIHQNPELGNREFRTAALVAGHLEGLGYAVQTGIAHTGVVAVMQGGLPGGTVALRADMDALPVTERVDVPFASKVRTQYRNKDVGVMHACGHDAHTAMLMGVAEVLAAARDTIPGRVMLIFQPAEEGAPKGEKGGARLMLAEGLFDGLKPDAVFGLHVQTFLRAGQIAYRPGPVMASVDSFTMLVTGRQTHGSRPWEGVDPIVVAAQIVMGVQTIPSRQVDVTRAPSVVSFGAIDGGVRSNIIPDSVEMIGTIRNFDMDTRNLIHQRLIRTATSIAESAGATAEVEIEVGYPVTVNDRALGERMLPTLRRIAEVSRPQLRTGAEDFSLFAREVPGMYFFLGITPEDADPLTAPSNHSPLFYIDESALLTGVRAMSHLAMDYLISQSN